MTKEMKRKAKVAAIDATVAAYMKHMHLYLKTGTRADLSIFFPYVVMDYVQHSLYVNDLKELDYTHDGAKWRNVWMNAYNRFNYDFKASLDADQCGIVIDDMDLFETEVSNAVMVARVSVMDELGGSLEDQKVLSALVLCNALTQCAQTFWGWMFHNSTGGSQRSRDLDAILSATKNIAGWYAPRIKVQELRLNGKERIDTAMEALTNRLKLFINEYRTREAQI